MSWKAFSKYRLVVLALWNITKGWERMWEIFEDIWEFSYLAASAVGCSIKCQPSLFNLQDCTWRRRWWSLQVPLVFLIRIFQRESILTNSQLSADFGLWCWFCRGKIACPAMHTNWPIAIMYNWNSLKNGKLGRGKTNYFWAAVKQMRHIRLLSPNTDHQKHRLRRM